MNNYIKNLLLAIMVLAVTSCTDILEPTPYSFTSPENFYNSAKDAEIALIGVYNTLTAGSIQGAGNASSFRRDLHEMLAMGTDEGVIPATFANRRATQFGIASFTSQDPMINDAWFFLYAGISRANSLLENLVNIPNSEFAGTRKVEIEAEAKLLRGFFHMMLSMMHGAIPVYTKFDADQTLGRQSVQEVYKQIIEDYEFAYANLKNRGPRASAVNKWTAAGLLVKVHTYLASMKRNGLSDFGFSFNSFAWVDVQASYGKAVTISADIVANSGYKLTSKYDYLFRENTKAAQSEEVLLSAEGSSDATQNVITIVVNNFCPQGAATIGGGSGWTRPTGELYSTYNARDFRFSHNVSGNLNNSTSPVITIDGIRYYQPVPLPNVNSAIMSVGKFRLRDGVGKTTAAFASGISFPLLRYADILLLRAEALFFTGDEAGARAMLSQVRSRAVIAPATVNDLNTAYLKQNFVDELLDERARELCFEFWRRFDLARFNVYDKKIKALNPSPTFGAYNKDVVLLQQNWKPEKVWFPIPLQQIDLNPNLVQNPGY
jgi:starch-binding outer membrane protein, SusD/RagB family